MTADSLLWLSQAVISVDVETETTASRDYPEILHSIKKFGLSALAPITDVALYSPELGTLHLNMRGFNPYRGICDDEAEANWRFIKAVLCRSDVLIVGHNVIFDLRALGVQYNAFVNQKKRGRTRKGMRKYWHIPLGAKVWCTEIIAKRMLLGEQASKKSGFFDKFDLLSLAERLDIKLAPETLAMVEWMKTQRANLTELVSTLSQLPRMKTVELEEIQHEVWSYLGGHIPPNREDLLQQAARKLLTDYVGFDAEIAYELYAKELEIAEKLAEADIQIGKLKLQKYPELTQYDVRPEFKGHLDYWTRYLRLAANRSAFGLKLNYRYLKERKEEFKLKVKAAEEQIMGARDPHEPYEEFELYASQFVYYEMLLKKFNDSKSTYNGNIDKEWVFWKPVQIHPSLLIEALKFPETFSEADKQEWIDFLKAEPYARFNDAKKAAPQTRPPSFSLEDWIKRNCYQKYVEPLASLLAKSKADWLRTFYTTRRAELKRMATVYWNEHPLKAPENTDDEAAWTPVGTREFYRKMSNSKKWIPYYLYCVAGAPLPSSEVLRFEEGMTTDSLRRRVESYKDDNHGVEPEDYQLFVVQCHLQAQAFSYGKKAQDFFLKDPDYAEVLKPLRDLTQYRAYLVRFSEIEQHAYLDGYVHSQISPEAKTGRNTSTNPNLQNVAMQTKDSAYPTPYPGLFIAPGRMHFISIDYSNAEIRMGNMIARDDNGAKATEDADYHASMAETYWPAKWNAPGADRKAIRSESKRITFAIPYGAGVYKIARMMKAGPKEARELLDNRKRYLHRTETRKKSVEDNARKRMQMGYLPVFTALWSKERSQIDRVNYNGHLDILAYPAWNYQQQGGVTAMLRRADVLISEMLEREGYKTFTQQDIHDELLFAVDPEEYPGDLFPRILQIMNNIVPEEMLERTSPKTHFIAEVGPENAEKWGYHPYKPYPFPLDEFISQWGHFPLAEGEKEAPTWVGPKHLGWTLEAETELLSEKRKAKAVIDKAGVDAGIMKFGQEWVELQLLLSQFSQNPELETEKLQYVLSLQQPRELVWADDNGNIQRSGLLPFSSWMAASQALYHRGKNQGYIEALKELRTGLQGCEGALQIWEEQYGKVFELIKE